MGPLPLKLIVKVPEDHSLRPIGGLLASSPCRVPRLRPLHGAFDPFGRNEVAAALVPACRCDRSGDRSANDRHFPPDES